MGNRFWFLTKPKPRMSEEPEEQHNEQCGGEEGGLHQIRWHSHHQGSDMNIKHLQSGWKVPLEVVLHNELLTNFYSSIIKRTSTKAEKCDSATAQQRTGDICPMRWRLHRGLWELRSHMWTLCTVSTCRSTFLFVRTTAAQITPYLSHCH